MYDYLRMVTTGKLESLYWRLWFSGKGVRGWAMTMAVRAELERRER